MKTRNRNKERGFSLLLAIFMLMLLTAVAAGMMFMASTETSINGNFKSEEAAYFAARAGTEEARDRMLATNLCCPRLFPVQEEEFCTSCKMELPLQMSPA